MKLEFKLWVENFTSNDDKLVNLAKRISSFAMAAANQAKNANKPFKEFQAFAANYKLHQPGIYNYLTTRYSGRGEGDTPQVRQQLSQMLQQVATINEPNAKYVKGDGWHHWIINGDMQRGNKGTDKTYVPVHYQELLDKGEQVFGSILRSLIQNNYQGQMKIGASPDSWLQRFDNIVLHSGTPEMAEFGAKIVMAVLNKFGVKIGGAGTTGIAEKGLDIKGTGTSFNDYAASVGWHFISAILRGSAEYDQFNRNIQNIFASNGQFVQHMRKLI